MLIPYDPRFYLSDADNDIVTETKKDAELIRNTFHNRIEWFVFREMKKKYPAVSLLQHDTLDAYIKAAGSLFNATSFEYAKPMVPAYETMAKALLNKDNTDKSLDDSRTASQYLNQKNNKYMNAAHGASLRCSAVVRQATVARGCRRHDGGRRHKVAQLFRAAHAREVCAARVGSWSKFYFIDVDSCCVMSK